jgi:hypothetical protein
MKKKKKKKRETKRSVRGEREREKIHHVRRE